MKSKIFFLALFLLSSCQQTLLREIKEDLPKPKVIKNIDIALVLGGGGSKAFAHLGVLEVLEKNHIPINLIVGTSAGALIGALYADNPNIDKLRKKILTYKAKDILEPYYFNIIYTPFYLQGIDDGLKLESFINEELNSKNFSQLKIPFVATSTDIVSSKTFTFRSGPIAPAIRASSAIPPYYSPVKYRNMMLADGGITEPVPVATAKTFNPKIIIAVNIAAPVYKAPLNNSLDLTYRSLWISYYELAKLQAEQANVVIHPNLSGHGTFEDHNIKLLYQMGKNAALKELKKIKKLIKEKNLKQAN